MATATQTLLRTENRYCNSEQCGSRRGGGSTQPHDVVQDDEGNTEYVCKTCGSVKHKTKGGQSQPWSH